MVFLTSIDIVDTGFLDLTSRSQVPTTLRANSGYAFRLKGVNIDIEESANIDESITPGRLIATGSTIPGAEVHPLISINPTKITLTLIINSQNIDTNNPWGVNDMGMLAELRKICKTVGVKVLYYPVDIIATPDTRRMANQLIYQIGSTDASDITQGDLDLTIWTGATSEANKTLKDVKYIAVRFNSIKLSQTSNNNLQVTLSGVRTA